MATSILVIDHNETNRSTAAQMLRQADYTVIEGINADDGLRQARAIPRPDLILLELRLPELNGLEVCRRIKADPAIREIPVILVATDIDASARSEGIKAGAADFLLTPYSASELLARVRMHLDMVQASVEQDGIGREDGIIEGVNDALTKRKQVEGAVDRHHAALEGINRILSAALTCATEEELGTICLDVAEQITQSKLGFIGEMNERGLEDIAISNPGGDACNIIDPSGHRRPPGNFKIHGLYGRVIARGESFLTNEPANHPDRIGLPPGHPPLEAFLGVPLIRDGRTIGMIAVGNRDGGYRQTEQEALETLAPAIIEAFMRKRAETALADAKHALEQERDILQAVMHGAQNSHLVYLDRDFNFVRVNQTYAHSCGYRPEEMIGKNHFHLYPNAENEAIFARVRDTGEPAEYRDKPFEFPEQPERGVTYWDWTLTPVKDSDGQVSGLIFSLYETTERKRMELNQALMAEVLRALNNDSGELHTLIADTLGVISNWTGFAAVGLRLRQGEDYPYYKQYGFTDTFLQEENFLCTRGDHGAVLRDESGQPVLECTCGLVLSGRTDPSMPCFTQGGSFWTNASVELLALAPENDPRIHPRNRCIHTGYQSVALVPVRSEGEIIGLLQLNDPRPGRFSPESIQFFEGLADNIGLAIKRKQTEAALRKANEQLAEADRRKDEFLAMLAHELRNPLAPVHNAVTVLSMVGPKEPMLQRQRDIIERQVTHMARLLDDLLDVSRVTRGKITLKKQPLALLDVLAHATEIAAPLIEVRRHTLHVALPPDGLRVNGDMDRLAQVVGNLLTNAAKYTEEGGQIWLGATEEQGQVVVRVRDTGMGIAPEMLPHIFDLFAQAERTLDRAQGGLGIGLTMVQKLVQMHGGTVEAHSEGLGHGSEFIVRLPALPEQAATRINLKGPDVQDRKGKSLRILVVDDVEDSAETLADLLRLWGHEVQAAHSGLKAIEMAREFLPEVVLLDIGMPGMNGFEVARHLREEHQKRPILLIAMTGYAQESDREESRKAGFDEHLAKPVDLTALQESLRQINEPNR